MERELIAINQADGKSLCQIATRQKCVTDADGKNVARINCRSPQVRRLSYPDKLQAALSGTLRGKILISHIGKNRKSGLLTNLITVRENRTPAEVYGCT